MAAAMKQGGGFFSRLIDRVSALSKVKGSEEHQGQDINSKMMNGRLGNMAT